VRELLEQLSSESRIVALPWPERGPGKDITQEVRGSALLWSGPIMLGSLQARRLTANGSFTAATMVAPFVPVHAQSLARSRLDASDEALQRPPDL